MAIPLITLAFRHWIGHNKIKGTLYGPIHSSGTEKIAFLLADWEMTEFVFVVTRY